MIQHLITALFIGSGIFAIISITRDLRKLLEYIL